MGLLHTGEVNAIRSRSTCMHAEPSSRPPPLHTPKFIHIHTIFINLYIFVSYHLSISICPLMIPTIYYFPPIFGYKFPFFFVYILSSLPPIFFAEKKRFRLSLGQSSLFIFIIIIFFLFFVFLSLRFLSSLLNVCHGFMFHVVMILDL